MNYQPINYKRWDLTGKGKNIINSLSHIEYELWKKALPYQDKRRDIGHAENVVYFALKLLNLIDAKREIIIPAAILHDIGWSQMTKDELDSFYLPNWRDYEPVLRERHQKLGADLAKKILDQVSYPKLFYKDILEIISAHDTRKGFFSKEDGVMRDADKLWRYTLPHYKLASKERKDDKIGEYSSKDGIYKLLTECIDKPDFFYSSISKNIARIELENTFRLL
jgi:hypothetical protein